MRKSDKHTKHLSKSKLAEAYGWLGSLSVLTAYALLSLGILDGDSPIYHLIFLIGSSGLAVITYRHKAYQSLIVNITFTGLGLLALIRILYLA